LQLQFNSTFVIEPIRPACSGYPSIGKECEHYADGNYIRTPMIRNNSQLGAFVNVVGTGY